MLETVKKAIPLLQQHNDSEGNVLILGHSEKTLIKSLQMVRAGFNASGQYNCAALKSRITNSSLVIPISCYPFYKLSEWPGIPNSVDG